MENLISGKSMVSNEVHLPKWLDEYIFTQLKANYCPSCSDMTVIDWDKSNVLNYLGTYFPRSYAEAYCIFKRFFEMHIGEWQNRESMSIFDFGCGTGGEIIGLLMAIKECLINVKYIKIVAQDGNHAALRISEKAVKAYSECKQMDVEYKVIPIVVEDSDDLCLLDKVIGSKYDIIMSFKTICEYITKERFKGQNAYAQFVKTFLTKLKDGGIMLLVDVTTYNEISQQWLPQMMDDGLKQTGCRVIAKNEGYNQVFFVSHSKRIRDISKVAWRIIKK